jgi:shikimate dehydrogenase
LILGTGAPQKAAFALDELNISYTFVSREPKENAISYDQINRLLLTITNYNQCNSCRYKSMGIPLLPYEHFTAHHIAFDLIYNPAEAVSKEGKR